MACQEEISDTYFYSKIIWKNCSYLVCLYRTSGSADDFYGNGEKNFSEINVAFESQNNCLSRPKKDFTKQKTNRRRHIINTSAPIGGC